MENLLAGYVGTARSILHLRKRFLGAGYWYHLGVSQSGVGCRPGSQTIFELMDKFSQLSSKSLRRGEAYLVAGGFLHS